jgi:hypothetical protein
MAHQRCRSRHRRGGRSDLRIGHAQEDHVSVRTLAATGWTGHVLPRRPEGIHQGRAEPATSNDSDTKFAHFAGPFRLGNGLISNSIYPRD